MKSEGVKVAAGRTMASSVPVKSSGHGDGCDDPRVKAMWDAEFFGHELACNYKIPRSLLPDGQDKRKQDPSGRRDVSVERGIWDEEFLGHRLPPNHPVSRFRTPEAQEKKQGNPAKISGTYRGSNRHARYSYSDDTFEYNFDKTLDTYVLSEVSPRGKDEWGGKTKSDAIPCSVASKSDPLKVETFEERALRFGVEDWNVLGNRKWTQYESNNVSKGGSKRSSTRRGIFHSPTGSDTSSMISTLESSSFSCGSEGGSSFAKTDLSSSSFNLSYVYAMNGAANPLAAVGRYPSGISVERRSVEEPFVEFDILDTLENLDSNSTQCLPQLKKHGNGTFFEFNFLDGKMVDSENLDGSLDGNHPHMKVSHDNERNIDVAASSGEQSFPGGPYQSLNAKSPDSDNFFDSSNDSDWSGTHSVSTVDHHGLALARDTETIFFDSDNCSNFTEDRAGEDWNEDHHCYDVDSSVIQHSPLPPSSASPLGGFQGQCLHNECKASPAGSSGVISRSDCGISPAVAAAAKLCSEEKRSCSRSPKKIQGPSRKNRSLGSVLSHHLAFTAVPSLCYRSQSQPSLSAEQKEVPAKVSAACIEWLWSEKEAMKPVQALRAVAEREYAERERIGSSPRVRALDNPTTPRGESKTFGLGKTQNPVFSSRCLSMDMPTMKRVETSPINTNSSISEQKESRDSILASWAAVYGPGGDSSTAAAAAKVAKRPFTPTGKVSVSATSMKHPPKAGVSPRKRSVSFSATASTKTSSSLAKQPGGPKSLALELEVLCRPFGPVLKGVRLLPTTKRGLGRPPVFSSHLASGSPSSSTSTTEAALKCGRLQCVHSRDGLPSYSLIMDETEEIFAAKTLRVDAGNQEGVSHVYTFHCYKGKGKGKHGWRQWGQKEKPGSDFAGNMTVTSRICPVLSSNSVQNYVESEFVLFDGKVKEISISGPTSTSPYPRSSVSSWDTVTPQRSPQHCAASSSCFSSPGSTYFSLPSPAGGHCSTPASGSTISTRQLPTPGVCPLDRSGRAKPPFRLVCLSCPSDASTKNRAQESSMSDTETAEDVESRGACGGLPQSQIELAAVVVRTPMEKSQGKASSSGDKWGWGINFLRKSFVDSSKSYSSPDPSVASTGGCLSSKDTSPSSSSSDGSRTSTDKRFGSRSAEEYSHGGLNITLILPSGEHGCSANGVDGPQPLVERWRSGGKCDCGSWDLGCGLTIVGNQTKVTDSVEAPLKGQLRDDALRLYVEGKKHEKVGLALTPLKEGCYTLGFQAPISPLHAFATAVAVLHSRDPTIYSKKAGEPKKRLTRIPVKVVPATSRSFSSRQTEDASGSRSLVSYKLVCPDPPSSPFGRA